MNEETKQFVIKLLVAGAIVLVLYFTMSPYQNCVRQETAYWRNNEDGSTNHISVSREMSIHMECRDDTTW